MADRIKYKKNLFNDWPAEIRRALRHLTISHVGITGMMIAIKKDKNPFTCVAFLNDVPIGWALICDNCPLNYPKGTIMVYVKKNFRCKGIGTALVKQLKDCGARAAISCSENSYHFWKKISNLKTKINVIWWDF